MRASGSSNSQWQFENCVSKPDDVCFNNNLSSIISVYDAIKKIRVKYSYYDSMSATILNILTLGYWTELTYTYTYT